MTSIEEVAVYEETTDKTDMGIIRTISNLLPGRYIIVYLSYTIIRQRISTGFPNK